MAERDFVVHMVVYEMIHFKTTKSNRSMRTPSRQELNFSKKTTIRDQIWRTLDVLRAIGAIDFQANLSTFLPVENVAEQDRI